MKTNKYKIIISLLLLVFSAQFDVHGQPAENGHQNETEQPDHESQAAPMPSARGNSMYGRFMELMTVMLSPGSTASSASNPGIQHSVRSINSSSRSGERNPFIPLTAKYDNKSAIKDASIARKTVQANHDPYPVIRLTATFVATGLGRNKPTVIIEESDISRFVSVGDTIAGMTIVEIQRGKVILNKGDKKCVLTLGLLSEEAIASGL